MRDLKIDKDEFKEIEDYFNIKQSAHRYGSFVRKGYKLYMEKDDSIF